MQCYNVHVHYISKDNLNSLIIIHSSQENAGASLALRALELTRVQLEHYLSSVSQ